jgi:hypothetical protein
MTELKQKAFDALLRGLERGERLGVHETCACRRKNAIAGEGPTPSPFSAHYSVPEEVLEFTKIVVLKIHNSLYNEPAYQRKIFR